jgi:hypothetical protein
MNELIRGAFGYSPPPAEEPPARREAEQDQEPTNRYGSANGGEHSPRPAPGPRTMSEALRWMRRSQGRRW